MFKSFKIFVHFSRRHQVSKGGAAQVQRCKCWRSNREAEGAGNGEEEEGERKNWDKKPSKMRYSSQNRVDCKKKKEKKQDEIGYILLHAQERKTRERGKDEKGKRSRAGLFQM